MKETRRKPIPPGHDVLLLSINGAGYLDILCRVAQTPLYISRSLFTQPLATVWKSQSAPAQGRFEPRSCWSTVEHANHQTTMTALSQRITYTPGAQRGGGIFSLFWGSSAKTAPPRISKKSVARNLIKVNTELRTWEA